MHPLHRLSAAALVLASLTSCANVSTANNYRDDPTPSPSRTYASEKISQEAKKACIAALQRVVDYNKGKKWEHTISDVKFSEPFEEVSLPGHPPTTVYDAHGSYTAIPTGANTRIAEGPVTSKQMCRYWPDSGVAKWINQ